MSPALEQLVREAMELTGATRPDLLEADAPVLDDMALASDDGAAFYLVGLIGGKEVGKSALVNALVGKPITAVTSHGTGTETAIAYVHVSQQRTLRELLDREIPGQYRIVTHELASLVRQVLVDLPDIDSKYASHVQVTRKMLRHMLYPVWVSSVEKYADQQPQQMLLRVSEGNTPANFIFCLNKVDQLGTAAPPLVADDEDELDAAAAPSAVPTPWGMELGDDVTPANRGSIAIAAKGNPRTPVEELREDFADRLTRSLALSAPPRIYMISAKNPSRYELPALRELLTRQKSAEAIRESKQLAAARQDQGLLEWLDGQNLALRAQRLAQLQRDAEDLVAARVADPIFDRILPRLLDDPSTRMAMADDILQERVAHWPVVNLVHTLLQSLFVLLRSAVARGVTPLQGSQAAVDAVITDSGPSLPSLVQTTFALLRQSQPAIASLYPHNKLWEDLPADLAAANLRRGLADVIEHQRSAARDRLTGRSAILSAPFRWLLTLGALLWFPFLQPILAAILVRPEASVWRRWQTLAGLIVGVLGVDYLLKSAGFLIIYYAVLWLALRWNTQRKVNRLVTRWRAVDTRDPSTNLSTRTQQWLEELTAPIRAARDRMESLAERASVLRKSYDKAA